MQTTESLELLVQTLATTESLELLVQTAPLRISSIFHWKEISLSLSHYYSWMEKAVQETEYGRSQLSQYVSGVSKPFLPIALPEQARRQNMEDLNSVNTFLECLFPVQQG